MGLKEELKEAKLRKELLVYEDYNNKIKLVEINFDNVVFTEKMINYNSRYNNMQNSIYNNADKKLSNNEDLLEDELREIVIDIDNTNSTHIDSDNKGRYYIPKRILQLQKETKSSLNDLLKDTKNYKLIEKIYQPILETELTENDKNEIRKEKNKNDIKFDRTIRNISFATKFCHYMTIRLTKTFKEESKQDSYSIYDSVLAKAIPLYIDYFREKYQEFPDYKEKYKDIFVKYGTEIDLKKGKDENIVDRYKKYQEIIDEIRYYSAGKDKNKMVSRNGFDHLLWYYYKGKI